MRGSQNKKWELLISPDAPHSVPNFSFLALLVTEIWRGSQSEKWTLLISPTPPSGQIFTRANANRDTKFQLPSSNSFREKEVCQNLMWGILSPCRTSYADIFTYAPSTWQGKTACQISASYLCIMQLCEYVFPIGFPLYVSKMGF